MTDTSPRSLLIRALPYILGLVVIALIVIVLIST